MVLSLLKAVTFNTVLHVLLVVTPSYKITSLLLHNCDFAAVMSHDVQDRIISTHRLKTTALMHSVH